MFNVIDCRMLWFSQQVYVTSFRVSFFLMTIALLFFFFSHPGKGGGRGHKISDYFEVGACSSCILSIFKLISSDLTSKVMCFCVVCRGQWYWNQSSAWHSSSGTVLSSALSLQPSRCRKSHSYHQTSDLFRRHTLEQTSLVLEHHTHVLTMCSMYVCRSLFRCNLNLLII